MKARLSPIRGLVLDKGLYPRRSMDQKLVVTYAEAIRHGAKFPPITVGTVGGKHVVIDGWHRLHAYKKLGQANVLSTELGAITGTQALAQAVRLNAISGR